MNNAQRLGLVFVFAWFLLGGVAHVLYGDFFLRIVPPFVGAPETAVTVIGVLEIAGAIGVMIPTMRRVAGWGLFLLGVLMTPANLYMWVHFDRHPEFTPTLLTLRMLAQVPLLALILFSTQPLPAARQAAA